jgi:sigma-B regulation protein RsbU (phosphoserine phosphatase)
MLWCTRGSDQLRELEPTMLRTAMMESLLESKALATDLARANRQLDSDARQIGDLQRSLLPHPLPTIPGIDVAASCQPCGHAGGDLYDVFPLDDVSAPDRWCVFIGDATGHGLAAAVVIAMVHSILRAHPSHVRGPADLLAHCNRHLCRTCIPGFVTGFIGVFEASSRRLTYASAGHPPPLAKASVDGIVSRLDAVASYPLGIDAGNTFAEASIRIRPCDTILLYTDGITEVRNSGGEMLSEERLELALGESRQRPEGLIAHLQKLVSTHREGGPPTDDQTLVAIAGV